MPYIEFVAGMISGGAGAIVAHPLDTVRVRMQTQSVSHRRYNNTLHCLMSIVRQESVLGLFKGMTSPIYSLAFVTSIGFGVYSKVFESLNSKYGSNPYTWFWAGAAAGLAQSPLCSPLELAKVRMQLQGQGVKPGCEIVKKSRVLYKGPLDCLRQIYHTEGVRGVMRGLSITLVRDVPSYGVYFASYYWAKKALSAHGPGEELLSIDPKLLVAGGFAGVLSWLVVYPIDLVKSRYQGDMDRKYKNTLDCAVKGFRREGATAFTHGLTSTMLRGFVTNAVAFFVYEWVVLAANGAKTNEDNLKRRR